MSLSICSKAMLDCKCLQSAMKAAYREEGEEKAETGYIIEDTRL